jgi:two-component system OmpR family sensor kinase
LAIVAAITAAHGGTASVHTAPGQGAVFRLSLPAAPSHLEPAEAGEPAEPNEPDEPDEPDESALDPALGSAP